MHTRTSPWPTGVPCWADITVPDLDIAFSFYGAVLGWTFVSQVDPWPHYYVAQIEGHAIAGMALQDYGATSVWTLYFASDDADKAARQITAAGGTVLIGPHEVGALGRFAIAHDPTGATFAIWQARDHIGAALVNQPGGMVWGDLHSPDPDRARQFYTSVFDFTHTSVNGAPPEYQAFELPADGVALGGIGDMFGNEALPAHWLVYFGVSDAQAAASAALASGGQVAMPLFDTPFGRMAGLIDPAGAVFMVVETHDTDTPNRAI